MTFKELQEAMYAAMKDHNKERKDAISAAISTVKKIAIDGGHRDDITEDIVNEGILKEIRTVKEQLEACPASRADLKAEYQSRYDILSEFAPKQLNVCEVKELLTTKYADVIATKNRGQIMKEVMPALKGKADGKVINQVVGELIK